MKVHHLNCVSTCLIGGQLVDASAESFLHRAYLTNHCLLVESDDGLVLIDTGFGTRDVENPHSRLSGFFLSLTSPEFKIEMTAVEQIQRMGFRPLDVRHIVLTDLDFDSAGGLDDFPWAQVHLMHAERDTAFSQATWMDRQRYRSGQWGNKVNWNVYRPTEGETWFGFGRVQQLEGLSPDIAMIPLIGHSLGHAGVAVKQKEKWLLHAGDAYFFRHELDDVKPWCTPGLALYQKMLEQDGPSRLMNQQRLRQLRKNHGNEVQIFCSHDVEEFENLSGRPADIPAPKDSGVNTLILSNPSHLHF